MDTTDRLRNEIDTLQSLLENDAPLSEDAKQTLADIARDIQLVLQQENSESSQTTDVQGIRERLRGWMVDFEVEHPLLANTLTRVNDLLSSIGI